MGLFQKTLCAGLVLLALAGEKNERPPVRETWASISRRYDGETFRSLHGGYSLSLRLGNNFPDWTFVIQDYSDFADRPLANVPPEGEDKFVRRYSSDKFDAATISWTPAENTGNQKIKNRKNERDWTLVGEPETARIGGEPAARRTYRHNVRDIYYESGQVLFGERKYTLLTASNSSPETSRKVFDDFADRIKFDEPIRLTNTE